MTRTTPQRSDAVLARLTTLHPKLIDLSLGRTEALLAAIGNPERRLPPVIHVAGTNGKGSVVAFLRAMVEAAGMTAHVYTSPHLVRFHERVVVAGRTISEDALLAALEVCETANGGAPITFFEITTAAAFLAFAETPADVTLLETGLGGRFDSTNVIARPAVTAITPVSMDHQQHLGDTLAAIAFEKAGILKPGVPAVIGDQAPEALDVIATRAAGLGAPLSVSGRDWSVRRDGGRVLYRDGDGSLETPRPGLAGPHQVANAGIAIAVARQWTEGGLRDDAIAAGVAAARWPARLQRLDQGALVRLLPPGVPLFVDGGHNPAAGAALAAALAEDGPLPVTLVWAMLATKDARGFLAPLAGVADRVIAIDLPGDSERIPREDLAAIAGDLGLAATTADTLEAALRAAAGARRVVVCGSLYLAGAALAANGGG